MIPTETPTLRRKFPALKARQLHFKTKIIKNIDEEDEEAEEQGEEEKQAVNITTNSPTSAPMFFVAW